jgi:glycosyltransferase involved in cell wall biosynthesis
MQIGRCLEALRASDYNSFEIIIVDDCSTDRTGEVIRRFQARHLRTTRKLGPAGARNLGVQHAKGEIVVFLDADVVPPPDTLRLIAEDFDRDPELAGVFGSYDDAPAWENFLSQYKNLMHHYVHQTSLDRAATFWAGCGAIRKEVFEQFGGFDASKFSRPSIEDIELGYRLTREGHAIWLDKRLRVKHLKKWTLRNLLRADILDRAVPWARLILETRRLPRDLNLTYASRLSGALTGLLFLDLVLMLLGAGGPLRQIAGPAFAGMVAIAGLLLLLNWRVYAWFLSKRGLAFTLGAILAHWFYYFYSGTVFCLCAANHLLQSLLASTGLGQARQAG